MKHKIFVTLCVLLIVVLIPFTYYYLASGDVNELDQTPSETISTTKKPVGVGSMTTQNVMPTQSTEGGVSSIPNVPLNPPSMPPGYSMLPFSKTDWPESVKEKMSKDIENLKTTGSTSGGRITTEFSNNRQLAEALEKKGLQQIRSSLAITPTPLSQILGVSYRLIGADNQAKYIENKGWTGFFQVFESTENKAVMVELVEHQLESKKGDSAQGVQELINFHVMDYPATFEYLRKPNGGYIYNIEWFVGSEREFNLSTSNLAQQEAIHIAVQITTKYLSMPNQGWRYAELANVGTNP